MVTVKTKFAIGDIVYHLNGTSVVKSTVRAIRINCDGTHKYSLSNIKIFDWTEDELYNTKEELADSQRNKVLHNNKIVKCERTKDSEFLAIPREKVYYFYNGKVYRDRIAYSESDVICERKTVWIYNNRLDDFVIINDDHFVAKTKEELADKVLEYYSETQPQPQKA